MYILFLLLQFLQFTAQGFYTVCYLKPCRKWMTERMETKYKVVTMTLEWHLKKLIFMNGKVNKKREGREEVLTLVSNDILWKNTENTVLWEKQQTCSSQHFD